MGFRSLGVQGLGLRVEAGFSGTLFDDLGLQGVLREGFRFRDGLLGLLHKEGAVPIATSHTTTFA